MSLQKFRNAPAPDFDESTDTNYEQVADPDYDEAPQLSYDEAADPDYDESAQPDYDTDFADPDTGEAPSQEWYLRKQK